MGSARKKKEKKKDFVKSKLKVGKTKPAATSHTALGFKAKSIGLPSQSITKDRTSKETFAHYLSLTTHSAASSRREAISFLQAHLPDDVDSSLFITIGPLIIDQAQSVRSAALSLIREIPSHSFGPHVLNLVSYVRNAMTHISPDVRSDSTKFLSLLLKIDDPDIPFQIVTRAWLKTLTCLSSLLGWTITGVDSGFSSTLGFSSSVLSVSNAAGHLEAFAAFLKLGLSDNATDAERAEAELPLYHIDTIKHLLPKKSSSPYARLGLFSSGTANGEVLSTEDIGARYQVIEPMLPGILEGLDKGRREGGEMGRSCKHIIDFLEKVKVDVEQMQ
ncbi:Rix1 complex component [Lipomyces japonicus]|uniref:Rix1 complex component n=1 Tax=Lipomyces japonicus TaxID=56871 RepID=UPI0034CDD2D6